MKALDAMLMNAMPIDAVPQPSADDTFLPLPAPPSALAPVSSVRSTLILSSLHSLRARGLLDRYVQRVAPGPRETLLAAVAGTWLPVDAALAHYEACGALGLDVGQQLEIAMEVGRHVNGTFLGTMLRLARSVGVTPWSALAQSARLHQRLFLGGGISVTRRSDKDADVLLVCNPLCGLEYFRVGVRGVYQAALQPLCQRVATYEQRTHRGRTMSLRISWV